MKGHEIAENLRNSKHRFTTAQLHRIVDGEDAFCVLGLKAFEAGVSLQRLDVSWRITQLPHFNEITRAYRINDDAARESNDTPYSIHYNIETENKAKQAVIDAFDSPENRDFDFHVEEFIEYLKETTNAW